MQNNQAQYSTAIERASNRKIITASRTLPAQRNIRSIAIASGFSNATHQMIFVGEKFAEEGKTVARNGTTIL
jgi:hypothetical protein